MSAKLSRQAREMLESSKAFDEVSDDFVSARSGNARPADKPWGNGMSATPTGAEAMKDCPCCKRVAELFSESARRPQVEAQPAAVAGEAMGKPLSVKAALSMCREANDEARLPVPMCWDLALYVQRLEAAPAAPAGVLTLRDAMRRLLAALDRTLEGTASRGWKGYENGNGEDAGTELQASIEAARALLAANSVNLPACTSSEASGSAIPARPTLPGEDDGGPEQFRRQEPYRKLVSEWLRETMGSVEADNVDKPEFMALVNLCDRAASLHPSSVQAVDGDEPTDTQMLDWLEQHFTRIGGVYVQADHSVVPLAIDCGDDTMAEAGTRVRDALRDAIRAAMKEQGQ